MQITSTLVQSHHWNHRLISNVFFPQLFLRLTLIPIRSSVSLFRGENRCGSMEKFRFKSSSRPRAISFCDTKKKQVKQARCAIVEHGENEGEKNSSGKMVTEASDIMPLKRWMKHDPVNVFPLEHQKASKRTKTKNLEKNREFHFGKNLI